MLKIGKIISSISPGIPEKIFKRPAGLTPGSFQILMHQSNLNKNVRAKIKDAKVLDSETLKIDFENGTSCNFKSVWLRDSCQCIHCVDKITKHKLYEFPNTALNVTVSEVKQDMNSEQLRIKWNSHENQAEHESSYDADWLEQFARVFNGKSKFSSIRNEYCSIPATIQSLWNRDIIEKLNLEVSYNDYINKDSGLFRVLENVQKYGISLIKGVPAVEKEVVKVSERIAFVKETGYGKTFQVRLNPHPKTHLTYTGKRFELHTDLSYFQNSPSAQLLHCIKAASPGSSLQREAGGISFFADAFYAINWLRSNHPEYFDILSTTKVALAYLDAQRNKWIRHQRCLIETNLDNDVTDYYLTTFSMRPFTLPNEKIVPFYRAYYTLLSKLNEEALLWKFFLTPGDLVVFNNKRIVHGRDQYDPTKVERHLEGSYMDMQEITALYEQMLNDKRSNH